jgi:hypothetical protein
MAREQAATPLPEVYRLSPLRRVILDGIAAMMFALPAGLLICAPKAAAAAGLILLCLAPTIAILAFSAWYPRLIVAQDGLHVRGAIGFSSLVVPWTNVERIWLRANKEGLVLREPLKSRAAARWKNWTGVTFLGGKFYDDEQQVYIDQQRFVPLAIFAYWLRHDQLGSDLVARAPWLGDEMQAQEASYRKDQSKYNRKIVWVLAISAVIIAATLGLAIYNQHQPPAQQAEFAKGEQALDRFAGRAFALSLSLFALFNIQAAIGLLRQRKPGYAAFWLFYALLQILLVIGIFAS